MLAGQILDGWNVGNKPLNVQITNVFHSSFQVVKSQAPSPLMVVTANTPH